MEVTKPATMQARAAQLVVTPHPLTTQGQTSVAVLMQDGETLLAVLQRHGVNDTWTVEVGGLQVPAIMWGRTRVHHAQVIECRQAVQKDVIKIIAFAALAYFTMGQGNALIAGLLPAGASALTVSIAGAVVFAAGAMVINKVLPPPTRGGMDMSANTTEPTYSLSGGRNQMRIWQPMSLVLGQPYVVPDLAGQPYVYFAGEDQYLVQQFHAGINCHSVNTLRIGQTGIEDYQNVTLRAYGLPGNSYTSGLPNNSVDSIAGGLLDAPTGTGPWVQRTTSINTLKIGIDIEGSIFGVNTSSGAYVAREVFLDIQYAVAGSGNWVGVPTGATFKQSYQAARYGFIVTNVTTDETFGVFGTYYVTEWRDVLYPAGTAKLTNASTKPLRQQFSISVPAGQYDVRLRKVTANETSTSAQNAVQWTQLKSFQQDLSSYPGQGIVALTIKASGQLSGAIDELNWIATAKPAPYWSGTAWVTATTRANGLSNPGAQILQLARGIYDENGKLIAGLGWPDSRIDIEGLKRFMVWCAAKNLTFDAIIQEAMSHEDLMGAIAYAGLATISWAEGRLGVQWLDDAQPVEGVINMGNIKARTFGVTYDTNDRADEIEYGYFDRAQSNSWNSLRVLAPGVSQPRSTARLSNMGITTETHAALLARHAMAQNIYMAKSITFEQDLEFLTYRRGTVLALSHDMTQWGYSGRVQSATESAGVVTLVLDDAIPATGPAGASSRYIGLRLVGETQYRVFTIAAFTGTARTVQLVGAWPAGVALPGSNGQPLDALWIYDFKATPGQRVVVAKIEPSDNQGGARVTVVPLPDEFWPHVLNGAYTPPPNTSLISTRAVATAASVTEQLTRQGNTYRCDLTVTFAVTGPYAKAEIWGGLNGGALQMLGSTQGLSFDWTGAMSDQWDIEVKPFNGLGVAGTTTRVSYQSLGLSKIPSNVAFFSVSGRQVNWSLVDDVDGAGYEIRWTASAMPDWGAAQKIHEGLLISSPWAPPSLSQEGSLLIKAVDTSGNYSQLPAAIIFPSAQSDASNVLSVYSFSGAGFPGLVVGGSMSGDTLAADASALFMWSPNTAAGTWTMPLSRFYKNEAWAAMVYECSFAPALPTVASRINLQVVATGDYALFYRTSASGAWLPWVGAVEAQAGATYHFKLAAQYSAQRCIVSLFAASVEVDARSQDFDDVTVPAVGVRLPVGSDWHVISRVLLTLQGSGGTAVSAKAMDKDALAGPLIKCFDINNVAVAGLVDANITGY